MRLSKNIVDALLLQYYEGFPLKEIANNQLDSDQKWQTLNKIKKRLPIYATRRSIYC